MDVGSDPRANVGNGLLETSDLYLFFGKISTKTPKGAMLFGSGFM